MTFPSRRPVVRRWAGATAVVVASSLTLVSCSDPDPVPTSGETSEPTGTPASSEEPTQHTTSETPAEPTGTTVPVYFVGDGPGGEPRLFREFHRVTGDPLTEAAKLVTGGGEPDDPDYRTLFPGGRFASVRASDGLLVVEMADDGWNTPAEGMDPRSAKLAIQQLVYTLQGVQQERVPIQVLLNGEPTSLFGMDTARPFTAASALRTLNLVSITSPAEGDTVTGDTLTVTGVANSFEASGPCRLIAGDQEVALEGYQAEGWMEDRLFPFSVELPLDGVTGEVVVQCETDDPSGGAEGNGPSIDTKTITVQ